MRTMQVEMWTRMVLTQEQRLSGISEKRRTRFRSTAPFSREPYCAGGCNVWS